MKRERINNISIAVNDAVKYALFPEHRDDRNADVAKLCTQTLYSLNEHRTKTARDLTIVQEMLVQLVQTYFVHTHQVPASEKVVAETQAKVRTDEFMELLVRRLPKKKAVVEEKDDGQKVAGNHG
jgi:hypothetical protein